MALFKLPPKVKRIAQKPLSVIMFRLWQWVWLYVCRVFFVWSLVRRIAQRTAKGEKKFFSVVLSDRPPALGTEEIRLLRHLADRVANSKFKIFSTSVPLLEEYDFQTDWRYGKRWEEKYFKRYRFYESKTIPYDVKFPWEMSRFHYLSPLLVNVFDSVSDYESSLRFVHNVLTKWRKTNRVAYSVNWYPMEASIRTINFTQMRDLVVQELTRANDVDIKKILQDIYRLLTSMLFEHAVFVWVNREYTDIRGNHFSANLVALLLAAYAFENHWVSKLWHRYAIKWLDREALEQFLPDGVNFEKSCGYHKLVLELFLIAAVARDRHQEPFPPAVMDRLTKAAKFSDAVTVPLGCAAQFGDSDDAVVLPFLFDRPQDHRPVVAFLNSIRGESIGNSHLRDVDYLPAKFFVEPLFNKREQYNDVEVMYFKEGGYVIARSLTLGHHFMIDVGEVGMKGRGGHGHNDLLAFEWTIKGERIVCDTGCSGYTADLVKKDHFRGTRSHSTVCLFGKEIAEFSGSWGIKNDAQPFDVEVYQEGDVLTVKASHGGYERIKPGVVVARTVCLDLRTFSIELSDEVFLPDIHTNIEWNFPVGALNPKLLTSAHAVILGHNGNCSIVAEGSAILKVRKDIFSRGYGDEFEGNVLTAVIEGATQFVAQRFSLRPC